jgi:glycosyltransferase involved in cell wall biosynthesis
MNTSAPPTNRVGSIVVPAYNEDGVIAQSLRLIVDTLRRRPLDRDWEILVIDDGSIDQTAKQASTAARVLSGNGITIRVLQHVVNRGLGGALQTGFTASTGGVVAVVDCDLSYHPDHIGALVEALEEASAQIAVASPYMPGGRTVGVPRHIERRSRMANAFLAKLSNSRIHTFTGMVRAYDGPFVRALALRSTDDVINVEALYKAAVLRGRIVEVPATLDWTGLAPRAQRSTLRNKRTRSKTYEMVISGLLFRPHLVFAVVGLVLILLGGLIGVVTLVLDGSQVGLAILGELAIVTGVVTFLASLLSIQVKRSFEELYRIQSDARGHVRTSTVEAALETVLQSGGGLGSGSTLEVEPTADGEHGSEHEPMPAQRAVAVGARAADPAHRAPARHRPVLPLGAPGGGSVSTIPDLLVSAGDDAVGNSA